MVGRDVERFEVVVLALDLRTGGDIESQAQEDRFDLLLYLGQEVTMPYGVIDAGEGKVDFLFLNFRLKNRSLEHTATFLKGGIRRGLEVVQQLPCLSFLVGIDLPQ